MSDRMIGPGEQAAFLKADAQARRLEVLLPRVPDSSKLHIEPGEVSPHRRTTNAEVAVWC